MSTFSQKQAEENFSLASQCESKAIIAQSLGDNQLAGIYRSLALLSTMTAESWLNETDIATINQRDQKMARTSP